MNMPKVAVVGCGYWGKNLVRNFHELDALTIVCDCRPRVLEEVANKYPVRTTVEVDTLLADNEVDAVVLATPAATHYELVKRSLMAGKDVYVEKPLCLRVSEAEELVALADKLHSVLMVGHILQYHPAILELKKLIATGELGNLKYIFSSRLNLGKLRPEEDILFSFAPHDISAILYLLGESPARISTHGGTYIDSHIVDTTMTTCDFKSGVQAHIFVSWLHPFKEQKLTIVGGKKMAVFDDMEPEKKLTLYPHRIDWIDRTPVARKDAAEIVELPVEEPLRNECQHFLHCVSTRQTPRTDGQNGLRVLRVLDACERSLQGGGIPIDLVVSTPTYSAHPTAVIDEGSAIGPDTKIWHFSHIMSGCSIGEKCNLGQNVVISPGVKIGRNVKIQNNVSVYTGVELEDDVFCGPSMVFTNVVNPRSHVVRRHEYRKTLVKRGASIGANATVVCGVTLGKYCFIGAGAVVTRDVPDYALMIGAPARQIGYMCNCGVRLPEGLNPICRACGRAYEFAGSILVEATRDVPVPAA